MNTVETKDLKGALCALWDMLLECQDQIATIIDTLGWPDSETNGQARAWLFRPGTAPTEITLAEYYAAQEEVKRDGRE